MFLIFAATLLAGLASWSSGSQSGVRARTGSAMAGMSPVDYPLNRTCVVTVDPIRLSKPVTAGRENIVTGFRAPDTVEGVLVRMDSEWLVLRNSSSESWIPASKVMMIHAY